ncbi:MAG: hypothetical protein HY954_00650 [Deltaproteobacteria bacterium]|nr:hypothetical protein [Deltaproteobacteria bacterium]
MKRLFLSLISAVSVGFISVSPVAGLDTYLAGDSATGISGSRHNLGGLSMHVSTQHTTEVCIFCHTPHHTNTVNSMKPMWNRYAVANVNFTAYGSTTANTSIINTDIGSVSLACLSCHDGVTTFDNIVNAPGKDGVVSGGSDRGFSFFFSGILVSDFMTSSRLNIGLDLSNDHPMSVAYNGGTTASLRPTNTIISEIDLTTGLSASAIGFDNGNLTKNLWAIKGYISDTATISDLLRSGRVECSSCHDPHFNNKSWQEIDSTFSNVAGQQERESNGLFMRRVGGNTGSGLCRTCHNK